MCTTTFPLRTNTELGEICVMNVAIKFIIKARLRIKMWFLSVNMRYDKKKWTRPRVKIKGDVLGDWIDCSPLSKNEIAELLGCTRRTINRWIKETRNPRVDDQRRLIELTGLNFWVLFEKR